MNKIYNDFSQHYSVRIYMYLIKYVQSSSIMIVNMYYIFMYIPVFIVFWEKGEKLL